MKKKYIIAAVITLLLVLLITPLIGIHYPHIIEDQPLKSPVLVVKIHNKLLTLEDGRTLEVISPLNEPLEKILKQSDNYIDLEAIGKTGLSIYARQDGWICGTPWSAPIRIPIIKDTVYKNRRELIAAAEVINVKEK